MKLTSMFGLGLGLILAASSCKEADLISYEHSANVYFDLNEEQRDSIVYTFAYDMSKSSDTIAIPVRLMGIREDRDRSYLAYVEKDSSTAKEDLHYEPLKAEYALGAGIGQTYLPVIINNVPELEERSVSLIVKLQESSDLGIENPAIIRAKLVFSARLEKPNWWDSWPLGEYSRIRHQLFFLVTEQTELTTVATDPFGVPKNLYFANLLTIMLNDPFRWVAEHPEKGYVLEEQEGGSYHFYHPDNPAKIIELRYNAAAGRYYFIDEEGKEIR